MKILTTTDSMFSQLDPRWDGVPLGVYGGHTLGTAGCLVDAAAGMMVAFGKDTDPGRLNRWLCKNNGFVSGNLLSFGALEAFGGLDGVVVDCLQVAAPMDEVAAVLDAGGGVLALVDFVPGGSVNQHWVRVLRLAGDDALIHDPWFPPDVGAYWMLPVYAHHTWDDAARSIFRLAMYLPAGVAMADAVADVSPMAMTAGREAWQRSVCARR